MNLAIRLTCVLAMIVLIGRGYYLVNNYNGGNEETGVAMVNMLYTYEQIQDVYDRQDQIHDLCTEETWEMLSVSNTDHWNGTWERTKNFPSTVRVIYTRPGFIVYALENDFVYPQDLWCFEYELKGGKFSSVREYKLVGLRESKDGGFF